MTYVTKRAREQGKSIIDATSPLEVEVTSSDIKQAKVKNAKMCAFAVAMKRENNKLVEAYFLRSTAWLEYPERLVRYHLPPTVQKEIMVFDRGGAAAPGVYRLTPPCPARTLPRVRKQGREKTKAMRKARATGKFSGARLREVRSDLRMSQTQLAQKAGVPQTTISRYERDISSPDSVEMGALAKATGKRREEFLDTRVPVKKITRVKNIRTLHDPGD